MDRKNFLKTLGLLPLAGIAGQAGAMNLQELSRLSGRLQSTGKMPVLFIGHGNPMNAITDNAYSRSWAELGKKLMVPHAILCISAHWLTSGTSVTMSSKPETIHDFGGFPDELFGVQYPAPGAVDYARLAASSVQSVKVHEDYRWGLDHGAWSVLRCMYPLANIPVFQMSIDYSKPPQFHFNLAGELAVLRTKGVLIVASGNIVHNLGMISWNKGEQQYDWAIEFDNYVKKSIEENNPVALTGYAKLGKIAMLAHPSNDHYLPLLYAAGLRVKSDSFRFFNDSFDLGSISMRSVVFS